MLGSKQPELPIMFDLGDGPIMTVIEYVLYFYYLIAYFLSAFLIGLTP